MISRHGRDNKLKVWQLPASSSINPGAEWSQQGFSTVPPIEDAVTERKPPWLLHSLTVNALNFCSFAMISPPSQYPPAAADQAQHNANGISFDHETLIVATPGLEDGQIILTSLPSETRLSTVLPPAEAKPKTGMVMAIALHYPPSPPSTTTAASTPSTAAPLPSIYAGYESGHTAIFIPTPNSNPSSPQDPLKTTKWQTTYLSQPHTQPLLSLCLSPKKKIWYSSSADAVIARHPLYPCPATTSTAAPKVFGTKHAGQQSLTVRGGDEKVMASAGWDGRVRVYAVSAGSSSNKSREEGLRELACLKWHAAGVGSVAFGEVAGSKKGEGGAAGVDGEEEKGKRVLTTSEGGRRLTVAEQRVKKTRETHWLAAGGKDGRISLWDIY